MANRLATATSPYLRQHAGNPVAWHPWGEEALTLARTQNRPILLSIGYSACHWCHVMAHESFEDDAVAAAMNERFVNIKVDREERPDLDQIYQTAHALMTRRSGGWPLTMFLTPDGAPYFAGTYFPKLPRYGVPGFLDILPRIADAYHEQGPAIAEQSERLSRALASLEPDAPAQSLPAQAPAHDLALLEQRFDAVDGGFGGAPKFPHAAEIDFCLRAAQRGDDAARTIVRTSLSKMAAGGIFDQLGGGFCRYSVDAQWSIPHFEKMLYDNAALLALYADASRAERDPSFRDVAMAIVGWLVREMRAPDGAFFSSLDADSEGVEGKYYVWTREEARAALSDDQWTVAAPYYGLDGPPNFEHHAWNLRIATPASDLAARLGMPPGEVEARLAHARTALFATRSTRVRPGLDDKILTSWNALTIAALARAARALDEPPLADLAFAALDTLVATAWREGRLYATRHGDAPAALPAYLDDHAFLLAALLEAMQTRFRSRDFALACEIADALLARFEDRDRGGFWFTSHDHERLYHRTKPAHDNATPSGNGVAAQALTALGQLAGEMRYIDASERAVKLFAPGLTESPGAQSTLQVALERLLAPPTTVVLDGDRGQTRAWQRALERGCRPDVLVVDIAGAGAPPPLRKGRTPASGACGWMCRGMQCLPPVATLDAITAALDAR